MVQIIGDFKDQLPACQEYLTIVLSPCSTLLQERWHHNGLSADFMADYFAAFFPRAEYREFDRREFRVRNLNNDEWLLGKDRLEV